MRKKHFVSLMTIIFLLLVGTGNVARHQEPEYGPAKGTLLIVGGNMSNLSGIAEKFIELAGGPNANFVIVPGAGGNKNPDGSIKVYKEEEVIAPWLKRGLKNVKML